MDEDDLEYQPPDEMFYWPGTGVAQENRKEWISYVRIDKWVALKPPPWWLDQQDEIGREASKFAIWNRRYNHEKQLSKWLVAPLDDFRRAGYLVRR